MSSIVASQILITVDQVSKHFPLPDGKGEFTVLSGVNLTVRSGSDRPARAQW